MDFDDVKVEENLEESMVVLDAKEIRKIKNENLKKALELYKKGNISLRAAANAFSVNATTLKRYYQEGREETQARGTKPTLPPEIEQQLVDWMNQNERFGCCHIGRKQLQEAARFLTKDLETKFSASVGWIQRFVNRKGIHFQKGIIEANAWLSNVNRGLQESRFDSVMKDASRVWRCDQALLNILSNGDLEVNPRKGEGKYALFNFSAHGEALKPHLINKGAPKRLKVAGVTAANTEDGNVTHEEFSRYLEEDFVPQLQLLGVQFPIVLFLGPETRHDHIQVWQTAKKLGINIVSLHSDITKRYEKDNTNILKGLGLQWRQIRNSLIESTKLRSNCMNMAFVLNQLIPICFTKNAVKFSFEVQGLFPWYSSTNQNVIKIEPSMEIDQMNEIVEVTLERPLLFKCRACRREGDEDFVSMEEEGLSDVFKDLTGIVVDEESPSFVCMKCKIQLESFADFRRLCLSSQEAFEAEKEVKYQVKFNESSLESPNVDEGVFPEFTPVFTPQGGLLTKERRHEFKGKEVDNIVCNDCSKIFQRRMFLNHWFYVHKVDSESSICTECNKSLPSTYQLEFHLRKKHGILKCIGCNRIDHVDARPNAYRSHKVHMKQCTKFRENYSYECKMCGLKYSSPLMLKKHHDICKGGKIVVCEQCGASVPIENYSKHKAQHNLPKLFQCRYCSKTFTVYSKYQYHDSTAHSPSEKPFHCAHCSFKFKMKHRLEYHLKKKHFGPPKSKKTCEVCGMSVASLSTHMIGHTNVRRFACEVPDCGASFKRAASLTKHKFSHSKTRPFNCTLCTTGYYQTAYLRDHYKRTHGIVYEKGQTMPIRKGTNGMDGLDMISSENNEENMYF